MYATPHQSHATDMVDGWWKHTIRQSEHFFRILAQFNGDNVTADYLITLQIIHTRLEKAYCPPSAAQAHQHLLAAVEAVLQGVCAALAGNRDNAQAHMDAACVGLYLLETELARLGIVQ
ncbi:MAG: hypothetical protein HXY40_08165 [Chloroflexi bacterium]|nr:hypothetical protein [Chloroflexota bacterium]